MPSLQLWDPDLCQCRCRPEEEQVCQTGYTYDGVYTCQCLPVTTCNHVSRVATPVLAGIPLSRHAIPGRAQRPHGRLPLHLHHPLSKVFEESFYRALSISSDLEKNVQF